MSNWQLNQRLELALASWPRWTVRLDAPPRLWEEITTGLTNRSWLLDTSAGRAVLRLNSPWDAQFNIDRWREQRILHQVALLGIAPAVWFCAPGQGVLVSEYIEGETGSADAAGDPVWRSLMAVTLERIQAVDLPLPRFDYRRHLHHYETLLWDAGQVIPRGLRELRADSRALLDDFQRQDWRPVLVHHDLNPLNLIRRDERLLVVDWEYAAMGYAGMDAACWRQDNDPHAAVIDVYRQLIDGYWFLLREYLQGRW